MSLLNIILAFGVILTGVGTIRYLQQHLQDKKVVVSLGGSLFAVTVGTMVALEWPWGLRLLESDGLILVLAILSAWAGYLASMSEGELSPTGFGWAVGSACALGLFVVSVGNPNIDIASPQVRVFFMLPFIFLFFGYFGYSLSLLLGRVGRGGKGPESFIAKRFLLSKASPSLSISTALSIVGVGLGVWLVMTSLGVLSGFEEDLRSKIVGTNAHIKIGPTEGNILQWGEEVQKILGAQGELEGVTPFVRGEVAVASKSGYSAGVFFGVEGRSAPRVLPVLDGHAENLMTPQVQDGELLFPSLVIGAEMAKSLHVVPGDTVRVISPILQTLTPLGASPKTRTFVIRGVFQSKMYDFDSRYLYSDLGAAREFFEENAPGVHGIMVRTISVNSVGTIVERLKKALGAFSFRYRDWRSENESLFEALKLERVVALIVLAFIILVACFSIVTTLTMSMLEKKKEIAILKTMGMTEREVVKVFVTQGVLVGLVGVLVGALLGWCTILAMKHIGVWIPTDVYYIDSLPVRFSYTDLLTIVIAALAIVWDFSVLPAVDGAGLKPIEGLQG